MPPDLKVLSLNNKGDNKMSTQAQSKREVLKEKVIALVKEFAKTEGGIEQGDLQSLFGIPYSPWAAVATALAKEKIIFS